MFKFKSLLLKDSLMFSQNNKSALKTAFSVIVAIFLSLILSIIIGAMAGYNPWTLLSDLFTKGFLDYKSLLINISILGIGALSFIFAFKTGLFNIGSTGQMLTAGVICLSIANVLKNTNFPNGLSQIFMIIIAIASAMIIGLIISLLKVYLKVNEVISSILLNWILYFIIRYIIGKYLNPDPSNPLTTSIDFPTIFTLNVNGFGWLAALLIFIILIVVVFVTLKYTVFGIKISSVGKSITASKYLGYNTRLLSISSLCISAGIAGILGYVLYTSNADISIPMDASVDMLPIEGSNGMTVGLIAMSNPIAIIPVSMIIGLFQTSSQFVETGATSIANLIIGFIILGAALFSLFYYFSPILKIKEWYIGKSYIKHYKTYINDLDKLISKYKYKVYELNKSLKKEGISKIILSNFLNHENEDLNNTILNLNKIYNNYLLNSNKQTFNIINKLIKKISTKQLLLINFINNPNKKNYKKYIYNNFMNEYMFEKNEIVSQFKKRNIIEKASKTFYYQLNLENKYEKIIHEYNVEYNNIYKKINNKIINLETKLNITKHELEKNKINAKLYKYQNDLKNLDIELNTQVNKINNILKSKIKSKKVSISQLRKTKISASNKINNLTGLNENEKSLVNVWINDSYEQALKNAKGEK